VLAVFAVYGRTAWHGFLAFDDGAYVSHNPYVIRGLTWEGLRWSFTTFEVGNWHPATWLSHMLDCQLFGLNAGMHHLVSVTLHAANAVVLFLALRSMTRAEWPSALVAALFALHPLRVESVAWAAERKDVLSGLFWMLALLAYAGYAARPSRGRLAGVIAAFAMGLLAKPMVVTLPFVLLLLDVWPLRRLKLHADAGASARLLLEKLPLFVLVGVSSWMTLLAQRAAGAVGSFEALPVGARLANAAVSYVAYLWNTLWPFGLAFYYPHPGLAGNGDEGTRAMLVLGAGLALAAITAVVLACLRRRPYLAVGWGWFVGTLVPVIGLLQVGMQARADRYTYLPTIGLYIALAWGLAEWVARRPSHRTALTGLVAGAVTVCAAVSWVQVGHWRDGETLARQALRVTRDNAQAYNLLGTALQRQQDLTGATEAFRQALKIRPACSECQINLATVLGDQGHLEQAATLFRLALEVNPAQAGPRAHNGLGSILERQGDLANSAEHLERAVQLAPDYAVAHHNLAVVYGKQGRGDAARAEFERALELAPDYALAHLHLGDVLQRQGLTDRALSHLHRAVELEPEMVDAQFKLAVVFARRGDLPRSVERFARVIELDPLFAEAHYNLGTVLGAMGQRQRAVIHLERALALKPDYEAARQALRGLAGQ
jgi:tetratricopeptide (TPR) repeat protein